MADARWPMAEPFRNPRPRSVVIQCTHPRISHEMSDVADDILRHEPSPESFLAWAAGLWQVEDDVYEISLRPDGGLDGRMPNGVEISAAWVISRGRKVPTEHSADPM
jgi:hypothetical protein